MARLASLSLILFMVVFASSAWSSEARKLLVIKDEEKRAPSMVDSLFLSALPKGNVPSSSPSHKGHAVVVNEKLIARHLISIERILQSVPSPGMGH
ncbi:precursor of CEP14 [Ziziphus jujuba]|uniref:Precursor of CEP14 n=1 Tax=Ziziphus jujuba TaxID=326968 RepID=A0A6P3ZC36_ZIZJJ|nr:precursor of CEP14 [Ziziphus jujuba]